MVRKDELEVASILLEMAKGDGGLYNPRKREDEGRVGSSSSKRKKEKEGSSSKVRVGSEDRANGQPARPAAAAGGSNGNAGHNKNRVIINERTAPTIPPHPRNLDVSAFPFGILHFITAVRLAFFSTNRNNPQPEGFEDGRGGGNNCIYSVSFDDVMVRLRSNPGDVRVLTMKVRLQDLVRGVLRMLSGLTAPPEISPWKPLVVYEKTTRLWSWVGPVPSLYPRDDVIPTSPEAWGMARRILHEMVGWFGGWLAGTLSVLQKIARLPPPPPFNQNLEQERFREMRNMKNSVLTIDSSSEEIRYYFRREEHLRYTIPEMAFSYTARDARKSTVAPLQKASKKAREHYLLKSDRPACFTILCLVRDAAARLPHGLGTNLDICCLVRDSQFLIDDVRDDEIRKVVSGALDRLQAENDPCIIFLKDRYLWSYLHSDKEEEDFDEDCTVMGKIRNPKS